MCDFNCDLCSGVCCVVPPAISSEAEIVRAKQLEAEMVAVYLPNHNAYAVSIIKKNDECPFLDPNGSCTIYNDRFLACREYECKLKGTSLSDLFNKFMSLESSSSMYFFSTELTTPRKPLSSVLFREGIIKKYDIPIASKEAAVQKVNATDPKHFTAKLVKTLRSILIVGGSKNV